MAQAHAPGDFALRVMPSPPVPSHDGTTAQPLDIDLDPRSKRNASLFGTRRTQVSIPVQDFNSLWLPQYHIIVPQAGVMSTEYMWVFCPKKFLWFTDIPRRGAYPLPWAQACRMHRSKRCRNSPPIGRANPAERRSSTVPWKAALCQCRSLEEYSRLARMGCTGRPGGRAGILVHGINGLPQPWISLRNLRSAHDHQNTMYYFDCRDS